ncbi:MAG: gliding motility-associated-like protein, partial [Sphingobacteriales bacterium]
VNPPPAAICAGGSVQLTAPSTLGTSVTFNWYTSLIGGSAISTDNPFNTGKINSTTTFYVEGVNAEGCVTLVRTPVIITILPNLDVVIADPLASTICPGDSLLISVSASGSNVKDFKWYDAEVGGNLLFQGENYQTGPLTSSRFIFVDHTNERGCISSRTKISIVVLPNPTKPTVSGKIEICFGQNAKLIAASQTPNVSFNWYADSSLSDLIFSGKEFTPEIISDSIIYVISKVGDCESDFREVILKVIQERALESPIVIWDTISGIQEISFTWNVINGANGYEISIDGGLTWKNPSSGFSGITHREAQSNPSIKTISIVVRAIGDRTKCFAPLSENSNELTCFFPVIQIDLDLKFFYNSFTPNDDGVNDVWYITDGLNKFPDNIVQVFNRWGEVVFETTGYDNEQNVFTGTNLPDGSYFYILRVPSRKFVKSGYVIIMR